MRALQKERGTRGKGRRSALGIAGASFPNVDYNIIGSIIYGIGSIFA